MVFGGDCLVRKSDRFHKLCFKLHNVLPQKLCDLGNYKEITTGENRNDLKIQKGFVDFYFFFLEH